MAVVARADGGDQIFAPLNSHLSLGCCPGVVASNNPTTMFMFIEGSTCFGYSQ
jgi:hypothetical protein